MIGLLSDCQFYMAFLEYGKLINKPAKYEIILQTADKANALFISIFKNPRIIKDSITIADISEIKL